jgi:hypothetical protein
VHAGGFDAIAGGLVAARLSGAPNTLWRTLDMLTPGQTARPADTSS